MTEYITLEHLLSDLDHSDSRTSFLHITEEKVESSPLVDLDIKQQMDSLEDRARELSALIRTRDRELDALYQDQSSTPVRTGDIDVHMQSLEQENTQLKALSGLKVEAERLRAEIDLVNQAIRGYEQKQREINEKLGKEASEDSASFLGDSEKITDLMKKISLFQHANGDLQEQVERARDTLRDVREENASLREKVVPELKRLILEAENRRNALVEKTEDAKRSLAASSKCRLASGIWINPKTVPKGKVPVKLSPKASAQVSPSPEDRGKSPRAAGYEYVPSFMRSKRPVTLLAKKRAAK